LTDHSNYYARERRPVVRQPAVIAIRGR
jgi:hypothetical protein